MQQSLLISPPKATLKWEVKLLMLTFQDHSKWKYAWTCSQSSHASWVDESRLACIQQVYAPHQLGDGQLGVSPSRTRLILVSAQTALVSLNVVSITILEIRMFGQISSQGK